MKIALMAGVALTALSLAAALHAQSATATVDSAAAVAAPEEIMVYGRGQTRQILSITPSQIAAVAPGSSPIKVLATLPGVNFQSSDPYGAYEWAVRISVRGFSQNQMGFTLDGVPLGDMSYGNYNGLHVSRAISSENLGQTNLSEGTGALGTASSSNLGGTIEFASRAPSNNFGVLVAGTYGSYRSNREFVRLDSGEVTGGGKGYVSFTHQFSDKWKGEGVQKAIQVNGKWVQPIGPVKLTGFVNYSDRRENDYQDLDQRWLSVFGYKLDNISDNFPLAVAIANVYNNNNDPTKPQLPYPAPLNQIAGKDEIDAVYFNASGLRKDVIGGLKADWQITPDFTVHVSGYGHHNDGQGLWYTPYVGTPGGPPLSVRTTEYTINRGGVIASVDYKIAGNDIEGGVWYEDNSFQQARRFYGLDATGTNRNSLDFQTNPFFTQWVGHFKTKTVQFHLQDSWQVTNALKLNFGFKSLNVDVVGAQDIVDGKHPVGEIKSKRNFLPQAGVNYKIDGSNEVFADYAENMRAFVGANTGGPFSTNQVGFDAIKSKLKPETSQTGELGYRFHAGPFQAVVAGYYVKFHDRLLATQVGAGIIGNPSALSNVGSVTTKGVEVSGAWKFAPSWSLMGSYAYNNSKYDQNTIDGSGNIVALTGGKTVVDAPKSIANATLGYDNGSLFGSVNVAYTSPRFYTYTNDRSVPGHAVVDLALGYRFHDNAGDVLKGVEIQANVANATNTRYYGAIGSNGYGNSGDNDTLQAGAPVEAFISVRKQF